MYTDFQCSVRVMNSLSDWFTMYRGIQQGAPLSLLLYQVYTNDLLIEMKKSYYGTYMYGTHFPCIAFADGLAIMSNKSSQLQCLLDIAYRHSKKWRYEYNAAKSEILCIERKKTDRDFWLNREKIPIKQSCVHLGTIITQDKNCEIKYINDKICKAKRTLASMSGLGNSNAPVNACVLKNLYWTLCMPVLTYGCEVMCLRQEARDMLEKAHFTMCKQIQGLPKQTATPCVLPQLNCISMNCYIDYMQLSFLWRVLTLSVKSLYKVITIKRILRWCETGKQYTEGPVFNCLYTAKRYNVINFILEAIVSGEYMSIDMWKSLVKLKIKEHEKRRHVITRSMYVKAELYNKCVKFDYVWPWYAYAKDNPRQTNDCNYLMRIMLGYETQNVNYGSTSYCACRPDQTRNIPHILFDCSLLQNIRLLLWNDIMSELPQAFVTDFCQLNSDEKCSLLFSGFN